MTKTLYSLGKLISSRITTDKKQIPSIIKTYVGNDWLDHSNFCSFNLFDKKNVYKDENIDIFIISWSHEYVNNIHNHPENGCWLKVMNGLMYEHLYNKDFEFQEERKIEKNQISYIDNNIGYHGMVNKNFNKAVTLNVYSPPNFKNRYWLFNEEKNRKT